MKNQDKSDIAYLSMLETYKQLGIDSIDKAYSEKNHIKRKAFSFSFIVIIFVCLLSIFLSRFIVFWVMLALVANIWLWMSALYGFRFIDRYIVEELSRKKL